MIGKLTSFSGCFYSVAALAALGLFACTSDRSAFIGSRVLDSCNQNWQVCETTVGCILGPESYAAGSLPQSFGFIVQLGEPSTVRLHVFLDNATAAGTNTGLIFNAVGCGSSIPFNLTGDDFLKESQTQGEVVREALLTDIGDHLIQVESDARADYLVKVDVISQRGQ